MKHDFGNSWASFSAGTRPVECVHPLAVQAMREIGVDISGHEPKHVDVFAPRTFDLVVTVCGSANESCPQVRGVRNVFLPFRDPAHGVVEDFRDVRDEIRARLGALLKDTEQITGPTQQQRRRVIVIGAGPAGVEAALLAQSSGYEAVVYERKAVGANVRQWEFVRLFTPWRLNVSQAGLAVLAKKGLALPDLDYCSTGLEFVQSYLLPVASDLTALHCGVNVVAVARSGFLKKDLAREQRAHAPFRVLLERNGVEFEDSADCIIDASGVYQSPVWLGDGGVPALGERALRDAIRYKLPDVLGKDRHVFAGRRVLLVGSGFSAATALQSLLTLQREVPGTQLTWARRSTLQSPFPLFRNDPLPERMALAKEGNLVASAYPALCSVLAGVVVTAVVALGDHATLRVQLRGIVDNSLSEVVVDEVIALVGFKPDLELLRELQVHQCYATEGPMKLAATLVGSDCMAQPAVGAETMRNPEPGLFIIGSKSYGRNTNYVLSQGLHQVESVFKLIEKL